MELHQDWNHSFQRFKDKLWFIIIGNFIFGAIYFLVASESLKLATLNSNVSPVWPPTGIAIATVYIFGRRFLPGIFLGAWFVNFLTPVPPIVAVMIGFGNTLEALVGYHLLTRIRQHKDSLGFLTVPVAIGAASVFAPLLSAFVGVSSLFFFGSMKFELVLSSWLTWWVGDIVGALLTVPLLISIHNGDLKQLVEQVKESPRRYMGILVLSFTAIGLSSYFLSDLHSLKYLTLILPLLLVFILSKNRFFIYIFGTMIPIIALAYAINGQGPFNLSSFNQNLQNLEIFIVGIFVTFLILADIANYAFQSRILAVLLFGWIFLAIIFYNLQNSHEINDSKNMAVTTNEMELRITERLNEYIDVINGGRSLFIASGDVNPYEWREYVSSLNLEEHSPGVNGIGVIYPVPKSKLRDHFNSYKKYYDGNFVYKSMTAAHGTVLANETDSFIVTYIEPQETNLKILGLDMGSEKLRRDTATAAMITGKAQISPALKLIHGEKTQVGYIIFLPVYKKASEADTEAARIKNFSHWVYVPFFADSFLNTIFSRFNEEFIFQMYGNADYSPASLVYANSKEKINPAGDVITSQINLAGRTFYIKWAQSAAYEGSHDLLSTWIGLIGAISVLMIVIFIINLQTTGEQARMLAQKLHNEFLKAQDILKAQEAKIAESSKMASLGEMASSIAHEINNPLTIIYGKARQIQSYIESKNPQALEKALQDSTKIISTVDRISRIIKGLRKISRDASADSMAVVSAKELVEETLSFCQQRFQQSNIDFKLVVNYTGDVYCRQIELSQVILNLLNNSYDAVLNLSEKWVELKVESFSNTLIISITDSGRGIPRDVQTKIFRPFFTTKEVGKGTGLGLSISKGIVEAHFGRFYLDENCTNTKFVIEIPLNISRMDQKQNVA